MRACQNITRDHRARLVSSNRECFAHYRHISYFFNKSSLPLIVCIHAGNPRVPPRVLASGPKPCGGKYVFGSIKTKNNGVVLLPMTIEVNWSYSFLFAFMDGEDGNGLKLGKTGQFFQVWRWSPQKFSKNSTRIARCATNTFHILSVGCQECCTCELKY